MEARNENLPVDLRIAAAACVTARHAAGGPRKLAAILGISRQAVTQWKTVPGRHVLKVEQASGISRHQLRPDLYGPAPEKEAVG